MKKLKLNLGIISLTLFEIYNIAVLINYALCNDWRCLKAMILTMFSGMGILSELLMSIFGIEFSRTVFVIFSLVSIILLIPVYFYFGSIIEFMIEKIKNYLEVNKRS
jgi:hypothetical protein